YRWERQNVEQLLNDIVDSDKEVPYYLQPIVVSPAPVEVRNWPQKEQYDFDLIDGQQRLTTIFLILQALKRKQADSQKAKELLESMNMPYTPTFIDNIQITIPFELSYETRKSTLDFLNGISAIEIDKEGKPVSDDEIKNICESPDHLYMWHAYNAIFKWLGTTDNVAKLARALTETGAYKNQVKIIWYELPNSITDWKKFTDLNIGKIPLTNSELVKALFLRTKNFSGTNDRDAEEYEKQTLVAQWDQIERELSEQDFWGFLTRADADSYPTKIDLLFDLISGKAESGSNDKLFTFNYFVTWFENHEEMTGKQKWNEIYLQYQRLRDWWKDREIYHRLGYLVAIDFPQSALSKMFKYAHPTYPNRPNRGTDRVRNILDILVKLSLKMPKGRKWDNVTSFRDLKYNASETPDTSNDTSHHYMIKRYLTLYNIMVTESAGKGLLYPFGSHNNAGGGWSLEHIHAQKSETLNKGWQWKEWVDNHKITVEKILTSYNESDVIKEKAESLIVQMSNFTDDDNREVFKEIADKFTELIESLPGASGLYQDAMGNMALLSKNDNSTLNNSTFDVKRRKIIEMLSTNFVPIATERVFLKAISGLKPGKDSNGENKMIAYQCDSDHLFFWGDLDRNAYLDDMEVKLKRFL
ncbi:MAG: DUF262 domain-containing protein, partial [Muribaculum sp.]|nr:DUF262 domain-containing protein [Muribaculum sp.]